MFGRRNKSGQDEAAVEDLVPDDDDEVADETVARTTGPFDSGDPVPDADRLDLGGLKIPAVAEMQVRVEADPKTQVVVSATVLLGDGAVQVQAFAAPRSESLWDEVRQEIAASMTQSGAKVEEVDGSFGPELHGAVTVTGPDGKEQKVPAVFAAVDGPRWLLRMVFTGAAVSQPAARDRLDDVVRGIVVERGTEPMAPRALIPLAMPQTGAGPPAAGGGTAVGG